MSQKENQAEVNKTAAALFSAMVQSERRRQNKKFPDQKRQEEVSLERWLAILVEELGEFAMEVVDRERLKATIELAETAAVCQRIAEVSLSDQLEEALLFMHTRTKYQEPYQKSLKIEDYLEQK